MRQITAQTQVVGSRPVGLEFEALVLIHDLVGGLSRVAWIDRRDEADDKNRDKLFVLEDAKNEVSRATERVTSLM
jgi:hypothetical protein